MLLEDQVCVCVCVCVCVMWLFLLHDSEKHHALLLLIVCLHNHALLLLIVCLRTAYDDAIEDWFRYAEGENGFYSSMKKLVGLTTANWFVRSFDWLEGLILVVIDHAMQGKREEIGRKSALLW
jgi:hypothetical protein